MAVQMLTVMRAINGESRRRLLHMLTGEDTASQGSGLSGRHAMTIALMAVKASSKAAARPDGVLRGEAVLDGDDDGGDRDGEGGDVGYAAVQLWLWWSSSTSSATPHPSISAPPSRASPSRCTSPPPWPGSRSSRSATVCRTSSPAPSPSPPTARSAARSSCPPGVAEVVTLAAGSRGGAVVELRRFVRHLCFLVGVLATGTITVVASFVSLYAA